ncbi:MAG: hypothetical protein ACD_17C00374G0005 [uncultured bacterium]|nr:MAG: hypothetical protein ACD_17C00374G0005 [uncultured bacterium]OGN56645.1 MAG: hypothetical protein A2796_03675 [Chlamydiae bacterium RIFCSPHIGHO2_01_FULL_44_39]OGN57522.1 MAG: hypothetical protein A3C42_01985 [Chlamydiae bacterium RIFCSPHIGHO2_02_FULL_45_9]OGN61153.1 MAG: hypothetical protein A3D96_05850 [Chlamydiae bacterium RIFCSPHIGHO2_12_FULL_44_59]OGN65623.1 MAG: hypothetical protein A2978_06655 [Chlamydiae bacterium RIFCSPLOWO2_01_FULL_44_52]OGN68100.1 MAG: hypothetical protein A3
MFLEKCGKFFFLYMHPRFFFLLLLLPLLGASLFLFSARTKWQDLQSRFESALRKEKLALDRKAAKEAFLARYSHADPYFLYREIESFALLEREKQQLQTLQCNPAYPQSPKILERLKYIQENRLVFSEEKNSNEPHMKETEERQRFAVEMDEYDLKQLLSIIEDIDPDPMEKRPQILVKECKLNKTNTSLEKEVFTVKMDLLKREFNQ